MDEGYTTAVVAGMGGSSLAPDVLRRTFGSLEGYLALRILDSTDPAYVSATLDDLDPLRTLFLTASKSGTTTEPNAFLAYAWDRAVHALKSVPHHTYEHPGEYFAVITDPGKANAIAHSNDSREIFLNPPDIGGRYAALTYVGLVPASLIGIDLDPLLESAAAMLDACHETDPATNPAISLGLAIGTLAKAGRDKLTFLTDAEIVSFGAWVEQLIAESTGKHGVGIVPVDLEPVGAVEAYGTDRAFVRIAMAGSDGAALDALAASLEAAGHPVIRIDMVDPIDLGAEFVRWEVATAIAGAVLGIDPFDQPNVEEAKQLTRDLLAGHATTTASEPVAVGDGLILYGDAALRLTATDGDVTGELARHLARRRSDAYLCLQGFIAPTPARDEAFARIRALLRDRTGRATTAGYGPRFLHSTGQLHKGGAPIGWFIQLTSDHPADVEIPGWPYTLRPAHRRAGRGRLRRHRIARPADRAGPPGRGPGRRAGRPRTRPQRRPRRSHGGLTVMRIGFIGLGRMGANMVRRLVRDGHEIVIYNRTPEKTREIAAEGATPSFSIAELVAALEKPRAVWVMVPAGDATEAQIHELLEHLEPGDTIIDGGNTNFHDDVRRHAMLKEKGIGYVDAGTSGGIWGLQVGYCLMVGGDAAAVDPLVPIFTSLAPPGGYLHVGGPGAGHYVKMVHNGIEYGLMQAYAEGFEIMHASDYDLDLGAISELWMQGSVVRSWLLELAGRAFKANGQDLEHLKGFVADSGEGRWTVQEAIDHDVPAPVITLSLLTRFRSRQDDSYGAKVLAALRNEFGGHEVKTE